MPQPRLLPIVAMLMVCGTGKWHRLTTIEYPHRGEHHKYERQKRSLWRLGSALQVYKRAPQPPCLRSLTHSNLTIKKNCSRLHRQLLSYLHPQPCRSSSLVLPHSFCLLQLSQLLQRRILPLHLQGTDLLCADRISSTWSRKMVEL